MKKLAQTLLVAAVAIGSACSHPGASTTMTIPPELATQATVSPDSALSIAVRDLQSPEMLSGELEEESGRLVYSFDLRVPGRSGVEEIQVDARNGDVVLRQHETDQAEAQEK
jgi:uncharacterized membrane protein YkoI